MQEPMTFGEYLTQLTNVRRLSVADLTRRMNYRSKTSISRILKDKVSYASIEDFMARLEPMSAGLFSSEEMQGLRQAMEVSRLGRERYHAYRNIWRLVKEPVEPTQQVRLECYGSAQAATLNELTRCWYEAEWMEMTIINSGYALLFKEICRLLTERPEMPAAIRHYLAVDDSAGSMAEQLGALIDIFHDPRYEGYYRANYSGRTASYSAVNDFVVIRGCLPDSRHFSQLIYMLSPDSALAYESWTEEGFSEIFRRIMERIQPEALPLKMEYPRQEQMGGLIEISRKYLSCERDRAIYCLTPDVCFELIDLDTMYAAMVGSVFDEEDMKNPLVRELMDVHRARYENIISKRQKSVYILSQDSIRRFIRTGRTTDHVAGMREFTPEERKRILMSLARRVRDSVYLTVRFLKPDIQVRGMTLTVYDGLGVYLLDSKTQYDVSKGHSEAFLLMPELTDTLEEFFKDELLDKHTISEGETLEILERMAAGEVDE